MPGLVVPAALRERREESRSDRAAAFVASHPTAKLINSGMRENDFKSQHPTAQLRTGERADTVGYRRYEEKDATYEFLDNRLFAITKRDSTDEKSFQGLLSQFKEALGVFAAPKDPRVEIKQVFAWRLKNSDLTIQVVVFHSPAGSTEFATEFRRISEADIFSTRWQQKEASDR